MLLLNTVSTEKRTYRKAARAEAQGETRRRIAAATAGLHDEVGPARTTVAEIARRAGVQRLTVYKNFREDYDLFSACQGHFLAQNPPPDASAAFVIADPGARVEAVLRELYGWYRRTERTSANVRRDRESLPALDRLLAETGDTRAAELASELAAAFGVRRKDRMRVRATVALALDFWAWRRLTREGLSDDAAAHVMADAIRAAAATA